MFDIKNYFIKLIVKLGFRKKNTVGISVQDSTNIKIENSKIKGYQRGIEAKNVSNLNAQNINIDSKN